MSGSQSTTVDDRFERHDPVAKPAETQARRDQRKQVERVRRVCENPPLRDALLKAIAWQKDIEESSMRRADIARREGLTRARVTQIMGLLDLPEDVRQKVLDRDPEVGSWTIRKGMEMAAPLT